MRTEDRKKSQVTSTKSQVKGRKLLAFIGLMAFVMFMALTGSAFAGNLDSPAAPSDDSGRMYTLEQIYNKVHSGTVPTKQSGGFNEPALGPASTMKTLDDIYGDFNTDAGICDATAGDVATGKTFFATTGTIRGTNWGPVSGSASAGGGLPKTGQDTSYAAGDDETYGDPAGGYDVGLTQGEGTWDTYWTDGHRFTSSTVSGDDIVTDNATGLIWAADGTAEGC
ncbi:MAG: hypothetical protein U9Q21_01795, partial [Candidatus Auribacterota bacterium]|nr:hypothetical protein [Candidatus Auribacterota bacterium]